MEKKKKKVPTDINQLGKFIVDQTTTSPQETSFENILSSEIAQKAIAEGKNPIAAYLGQRGGQKGGKARAESLTPKKRKEIAQKAAKTRWAKKES